MKRSTIQDRIYLFTAVLLVFSALSVFAQKPGTAKVFLLAGQSNMAGQSPSKSLKEPYTNTLSKVKIWSDGKWIPLASTNNATFGPEISFGHAMAEAFPEDDIYLVKYAVNATALYNDWAPTDGAQYVEFIKAAQSALADLDKSKQKYTIEGMLWLQGESDALENKAESYEDNLRKFISHMRTKFKTPQMNFIMARVLTHFGGKSGQADIVRDAQVKVAKSVKNVAWFDTDDCENSGGHYKTSGLITVGKRYAEKYAELKKISPAK